MTLFNFCAKLSTVRIATNVGEFIKFEECSKIRLFQSRKKLDNTDFQALKKVLCQFSFICGISFQEYQGTGEEPKIQREIFVSVCHTTLFPSTKNMHLVWCQLNLKDA